ncbi:MAG TPA: hypothetical protein VEC37_17595 [Bacillota bacterium]|nr:hypothetical protein [Bacillota bacterium]
MDDFRTIRVTQAPDNRVNIANPTGYPLIGQGAQGAVFKLPGARCVKIYAGNHLADMEYVAYQAAKYSGLVPKFYEKGANYIVIEYLKGPSLDNYLRMEGTIPQWITSEIINVLKQMRLFQFPRVDCALRHLVP